MDEAVAEQGCWRDGGRAEQHGPGQASDTSPGFFIESS
jgi:hypothetical protein